MRVLAGLGCVLFAYLTLIPLGLVAATIDPSCGGFGCDAGATLSALLLAIYLACALALGAVAVALAGYAVRPDGARARRIGSALAAAAAAIGLALFAVFAVSYPLAALVIAALGAGMYAWLRGRPSPGDPQTNGHRP